MSSTPWLILLALAIVGFAYFEYQAIKNNKYKTLSAVVYGIGAKFPLAIWLCGVFAGGLAVHFFWHWCPPGSVSEGLLSPLGPIGLSSLH
jgi:hypothetical protein